MTNYAKDEESSFKNGKNISISFFKLDSSTFEFEFKCHNDWTKLRPDLGCGSVDKPPHENITVKYPMTDRVNKVNEILKLHNVMSPCRVEMALVCKH